MDYGLPAKSITFCKVKRAVIIIPLFNSAGEEFRLLSAFGSSGTGKKIIRNHFQSAFKIKCLSMMVYSSYHFSRIVRKIQ